MSKAPEQGTIMWKGKEVPAVKTDGMVYRLSETPGSNPIRVSRPIGMTFAPSGTRPHALIEQELDQRFDPDTYEPVFEDEPMTRETRTVSAAEVAAEGRRQVLQAIENESYRGALATLDNRVPGQVDVNAAKRAVAWLQWGVESKQRLGWTK